MEWLIKQRITLYRFTLIFYLVALNLLFYFSSNTLIFVCATIGNILLLLMLIGNSLFEKRRADNKKVRDERRAERSKKRDQP